MKKNLKISFVLFILTGLATVTAAQTEKGSFLLSGSGSLDFAWLSLKLENDNTSEDAGKMSNLEFTPGAGYFIADNLAVGLEFSLSSASQKEDGDKYTETTTMLLPFARLYFGKSNVKPFVQAGVGPGWEKWGYKNDKETENLVGYEFDGGLAVFISPNISLDFILGYAGATAKIKDYQNVEWKTTASGFGGSIGFSIIF
jgi:opacity protein-like surface antigen